MRIFTVYLSAFAFLLSASPLSAQAPRSLLGGFVEGADLFMFMDSDEINQAPIVKVMREMQEQNPLMDQMSIDRKFEAATGLRENDMDSLVFSMDIDGLNLDQPDASDFTTLPALMCVELKKSITLVQLQAGVEMMAEEKGETGQVNIRTETRNGLTLISLSPKQPEAGGPQEILATLSPDGSLILVGFNVLSLQKGLQRIQTGRPAQPSPLMSDALRAMDRKQFRIVFVFNQAVRDRVGAMAQQVGYPMFATTQAVMFSAHATRTFDLDLRLDMGTPQAATQLAMMGQAMLPQATIMMGQIPPSANAVIQKIRIAPDQNQVSVTLSLNEQDLKALNEAAAPQQPIGGMPVE